MNYIVFDLEWNQSPGGRIRENPKIPFEILEIGAVKLNSRRKVIDEFHETIKPLVYTRMNHFTQKVVHMEMKDLKNSRTFTPVAKSFLKWCGHNPVFVTWGPSDLFELQRNLEYYHIQHRFPQPFLYYDLQKLYSLGYMDGKKRPALHEAVEAMGIPQERPFHAAFDDAWYTAQIMREMEGLKNLLTFKSVDYYRLPEKKEDEFTLNFKTYSKFVSMLYPDKGTAMKEASVTDLRCHRCGKPLEVKIDWFSGTGGTMYYALCECPKHGPVKGKIRMRKGPGEEIYVVKTIKEATERDVAEIEERRQSAQERRHKRAEKEKARRRAKRASLAAEKKQANKSLIAQHKSKRRRVKKPDTSPKGTK
ncbi:MAG: DNA polymerase III [Lachnospiraceae bacterium]|nr:DNA polymerase III [Lachnospiraceae bacterium]